MTPPYPVVFLLDVDNTLIDNDAIQQDLKDHLQQNYGRDARDRYWKILEDLFAELGYRDYLGALQRFRAEHPKEVELLAMSSFLIDYPFVGPAVSIRVRGLEAAWRVRPDRYPFRWRRRLSATQSRTGGFVRRG